MTSSRLRITAIVALILLSILFAWKTADRIHKNADEQKGTGKKNAIPVEVEEIKHGLIGLKRTFSGALEAPAKFAVAPKVGGRIVRMNADLADTVARGQIVAELDSDEYVQAVAQARADVAVARANLAEAESLLQIALRDVKRTETLLKQSIANESQFDAAKQTELERRARLEVAEAQLARAQAVLETANIRLGYTKVTADWIGTNDRRVVAERYAADGDTVSPNQPLFLIVEFDPITAVVSVTEKDYARLAHGQQATLITDAYPGEVFKGRVERIAPIFREATRQARVELTIDNPMHLLKPGMFIRATIVLGQVENATIIPDKALTTRGDRPGIFTIDENANTVTWREVKVGIRENGHIQVEGDGLPTSGRVVTLGQHLLENGSVISVPGEAEKPLQDKKNK